MADIIPQPRGLSTPTVPSAWDTYAGMLKARNQLAPQVPQDNEQGVLGDLADSLQRGVAQTVGGDLETVGQLGDWQNAKDMGRAVSAWGDSQTAQMSQAGQEAMNKQFFVENEDGTISAGDAMTDWRSWANQGATLVGQIAANVVGTKGAGLVVRPFARGAAKAFAKEMVTEAAQKQLAKNAVKESIQNGALDDVRKIYAAAPDKAAQNAVINQALSRLGAVGYGAHSAAMASGLRAQQANTEALQHLNGLSNDDLNSNEAYQQAYWDLADGEMQGASPEQIRRAAIDQVAEGAASDAWSNPAAMATDFGAGMLEGAVGGLGGLGGVAGKIGKTRAGAAARGALVEGGGEALQAGTTQWAVNEAIREWADESRDPMAGVLVQALTEGVIAGPMGSMASGINGPHTQHGPAKVTTSSMGQGQFGDIDAWATKIADIMGPHRGNLADSDIDKMIRQSMGKRGASSQFADMVAARAKAMINGDVMPGQVSDTTNPDQQPVGAMGGAYDEFADTPAYVRKGGEQSEDLSDAVNEARGDIPPPRSYEQQVSGDIDSPAFLRTNKNNPTGRNVSELQDANPFSDVQQVLAKGGVSATPEELINEAIGTGDQGLTDDELKARERALEGELILNQQNHYQSKAIPQHGATVDGEYRVTHQAIGQSDTIFAGGTPGADNNNSAYTPPRLSRNQIDDSLGEQSTRDPRSQVAQSIERAGIEPDSIFGQLKSLRITKRGKPFASQKEAQLASRKTETPIALPDGGFGVVDKAELEQVQASQVSVTQPSSNAGQLDQADPAPDIVANPVGQDVSQEVTDGMPQQLPAPESVRDEARQDGLPPDDGVAPEQNTAPASDAGVAVSGQQSVTPTEEIPQVPWSEIQDRKDGTAKLVGDTKQLLQWSKDNGIKAVASNNGVIVAKPHAAKVKQMAATPEEVQKAASIEDASASVPWKEMTNNDDGTLTLKGDMPAIRQWIRRNGVKAIQGKGGMLVATSSAPKVIEAEESAKKATTTTKHVDSASAVVNAMSRPYLGNNQGTAEKETPALFSKKGPGLSVDVANRVADDFMREFKGRVPIKVRVAQTQEELYGPGTSREDIGYGIEGSYSPKRGVIGLVSGVLRDEGAARRVLRHEVLGHYGLDTFAPDDKKALLQKLIDAKEEKWIAPIWKQIEGDSVYGEKSELHQAEEVFAHIAEREPKSIGSRVLSDIKATISHLLRKVGLIKGPISEAELDHLIRSIAKGIRSGQRTKQNFRDDQDVIGANDSDISFSLSDAKANARGMTKPELEMVVTGWSKQYKGSASARIMVAANQKEMNEVLGMVGATVPESQSVNAAYLPGYKTLLLNAEEIPTAARARELLRHELLAHHGLREVVGDDAYISIIEAVKRGKDIKGIKDAYYQVAENYTDMHPDVQAEEVFAHWMENQPDRGELAVWWRGIVRRVKDALRAVGLVGDRTTEDEFNRVLDAIVTGMRNGRQPGRRVMESWHEAPAYSKGADDLFTPDRFDAKQFADDVEFVSKNPSARHEISMGDTPHVLRRLGLDGIEMVMPASVVRKATDPNVRGHHVPLDVLKSLPSHLSDPVAVMRSRTEQNAFVSLIEATDKNGDPVIVAIHGSAKGESRIEVNKIASVYGKENTNALQSQLESGLVYVDKTRAAKWLPTVRLQLPEAGAFQSSGSNKSVLTKDDIRNSGALFSLGAATVGDHLSSAERKLNLVPSPDIIDRTKSRIDTLRRADKQQVKTWWSELVHKANTQMLDRLAPIKYAEELAGKLDASESGYVAARLSSGSATTMQATLLYGLPEWKDGVIQKKAGTGEGDALLGIFEGLGKDLHNWLGWMAGHRAEILMQQGRENLLTQDEINALKALDKGKEQQFQEAKAKWNTLNSAVLDLGQEAGLFTAADRANWESEWYIPFFRDSEDGDVAAPFKTNGIANQSAGIKKLKGGTANVNDLLENIFTTTGKMIDASMKNMAAQKVVWNLAGTDIIDVIPKPNLMDMRAASKPGNQMLWVKIDGEDHLIRVNDPDLFRAMTMIDQKRERGPVMRMAMKAKQLLTSGVTASPEFMLRNFLRDAVSAWGINEDGFKPLIDSIRGVQKTLKMNGGSIDMMFSGASFLGGHVNGNNPEGMAQSVRKALRAKGMNPEQIERYERSLIRNGKQAMDVLGGVWHKYERIGEAIENGSREAVYEAAIKAGKSHAQAAFEAKDLMDFSMLGSSKVMQFLVDVLPFFNARMQGLGKLGRAVRNNPRQMLMRGGMIAGASLALLAINWDDDRYDDLPDWDKDLNWHFWFGDQHFRIPKPFEIGLIFGTLPERMTRAMGGKDTAGKFGQVVARNMLETFAINPIPQVVKPITEAYFNYDPFRGGPIDNMSDLNVLPEARYDDRTSLLMRELGELTGFSPKKLQHIVEGYTGTIGSYVIGAGDMLVRGLGDYGKSPDMRADQIPLLRTLYQGSEPARSSQAMSDYYEMLGQVSELSATIKQYKKEGRFDEARGLLRDNREALAKRPALTASQRQFRALRNEMELINRSKILTAEQKRDRIDKLLERRNNLASKLVKRFGEN